MASGVEASDELARRIQEVDALRRRVLNVIPHGLRTPITTFRGLADALTTASERDIRERIAPALQRLAAQAEHLLDDMLIAAGVTTTLPTQAANPTPVRAAVHQVWADVAPGRPPLVVEGPDAAAVAPDGSVRKILVHVLDNAAKYGTGEPVVRIERVGDRVRVVVDSPGPVVADVALLCEPFFRGEQAVMHAPGLGVGLAVARALAEHAGGALALAAREGGGVVTTIELGGDTA